ncbi:MAG TPA: N-acylglucosamine 2-epimerase [Porphyromonadaceae bacterium]|nr:N-acylglucosamine 2-epimerase [Porphyromonadaceae bacterium]
MKNKTEYLKEYAQIYHDELVNNIVPFWLEHSVDREFGGFTFALDRDGTVMDTTKVVWIHGRFAWLLASMYNEVEPRKEWLEMSKHGIDFLEKHCFDTDGRMYFLNLEDGTPLRKRRYVFSETFAAIAFAAYAKASGDMSYAQKALDLFKLILHYKNTPGLLQPKNIPGARDAKGHSMCMILINTAYEIRKVIQDPILDQQIEESIQEIKRDFMKPEFKAVLETVGPNGEFINSIDGRCINPGHSIETAWFILEEAKHRGWDKELVEMGTTILDWSWQWGWDEQHGGILYFRDCKNFPPQEYWHDMKFWWPQNEALIATLYAYQATKDEKYLDWHKKIHTYQFTHFPDKVYGEWYGYLHKDGSVSQPAKGNFFKGPFHIPRMLLKGWQLSSEIIEKG